jgi:hypothetical protein
MFFVLVGTVSFAQEPNKDKESGIRGRVVVEPELLAATEGAVDEVVAAALRTPSYVRRPRGRRVHPVVASLPELQVVLQGEDTRADNAPPKTVVFEGHRFTPPQTLLTRPGPLAVENRHKTPITFTIGAETTTIGPGETKQLQLAVDKHVLTPKEFPYAKGQVTVLERGIALPVDDNGDIAFTQLVEGEYNVTVWLGTSLLYQPTPFRLPRGGLSFIDATVSANRVVTVAIKDASLQVAVPVAPIRPPPPPPPDPEP